ncbi:hypothetical protein PR048_011575, partial [Dryococelus australis]
MGKSVDSLKVIFCEGMVHIQCWAHKLNIITSFTLPELNKCVQNADQAFLNTRKRKHSYITFLSTKYPHGEKKALLFLSPYISEYLPDSVELFQETDYGGSANEYFHSMTTSQVDTFTCAANFLVEYCSSLVENIVELKGSTYSLCDNLNSMLDDLESNFCLVSRCALKEDLKSLRVKCHLKLQNLREKDTAKGFFSDLGRLFDVRNIASMKNSFINQKHSSSQQTDAARIPVMLPHILEEMIEGIFFTRNILNDLRTGLKASSFEIMPAKYFGST